MKVSATHNIIQSNFKSYIWTKFAPFLEQICSNLLKLLGKFARFLLFPWWRVFSGTHLVKCIFRPQVPLRRAASAATNDQTVKGGTCGRNIHLAKSGEVKRPAKKLVGKI